MYWLHERSKEGCPLIGRCRFASHSATGPPSWFNCHRRSVRRLEVSRIGRATVVDQDRDRAHEVVVDRAHREVVDRSLLLEVANRLDLDRPTISRV
jgi:hypothetical protein